MKSNASDLEKLKSLLLADELELLHALESRLASLQIDLNDQNSIAQRILPLFDALLLERLKDKDEATVGILSNYLAAVIAKASKEDLPSLSRSLQSAISPAIASEIAANKDSMVDALYPIMGGMVSKYVSQSIKELMENINARIEDGLSARKIKRKIKAKFTGVSETELLLKESGDATMLSLLVIQKDTGLLIAEARDIQSSIEDPHMVASMASAIKDFINDWIARHEGTSEVQILSYANATLYIESAGSVYLVAFFNAEPNNEQRQEINRFFGTVVKKYASFFARFDGDDSAEEVSELSSEMTGYLRLQPKGQSVAKSSRDQKALNMVFALLGLALIGYLGREGSYLYDAYKLEEKLRQTTGYAIDVEVDGSTAKLYGEVKSFADEKKVRKAALADTQYRVVSELVLSSEDVANEMQILAWNFEKSLDEMRTVMQKEKHATDQALEEKDAKIAKLQQKFEHASRFARARGLLILQLKQAFGKDENFRPSEGTLEFTGRNFFEAGSIILSDEAKSVYRDAFVRYMDALMQDEVLKEIVGAVIIEGHADSSGNEAKNVEISLQRAQSVKEFFLSLDVAKKYGLEKLLLARGVGSSEPVVIDGTESKDFSRRIKILFTIDEPHLTEMLKKIIDD